MWRRPIIYVALGAALLSASLAHAAGIRWSHSLKAAFAKARTTHKLVMLDIYTDWCYWCKRLDIDVYPHPSVVKAVQQVIPVKLNAETTPEGQKAAMRYQVTGFPTILFLDGQGNVVGRIGGYEPAPNFAADVNHIVAEYAQLPKLQAYVRSHPQDGVASLKLLHIYVESGRPGGIAPLIAQVRRADPNGRKSLLPEALLLEGSAAIHKGNVQAATAAFREAAQKTTVPDMKGEAHMYLAIIAASQNQLHSATRELKTVLAIPHCSSEMRRSAQTMLSQIEATMKK